MKYDPIVPHINTPLKTFLQGKNKKNDEPLVNLIVFAFGIVYQKNFYEIIDT